MMQGVAKHIRPTIEPRWLTIDAAADYLSMAPGDVRELCRIGLILAVKLGPETDGPDRRHWRVDRVGLDEYLVDRAQRQQQRVAS